MYDTDAVDTRAYREALKYISGFQFHGFRLGLERMESILAHMGDPHRKYPCIHVAGTNGKGSVCAYLESIFLKAGIRCGLYTSPHLSRLEERFRVNGKTIGPSDLARLINCIRSLVDEGFELSYFEYTTVIAMAWFREMGVECAIFETGLGGRLDATNVITPMVSVITNISLEHQTFLGDTLEKIAWEKAGIVKQGVPVVSGVKDLSSMRIIESVANGRSSPLYTLGKDFHFQKKDMRQMDFSFPPFELRGVRPGLIGLHQMENACLAMATSHLVTARFPGITHNAIKKGIEETRWQGRGEMVQIGAKMVLLDGAHNPAGIDALSRLLGEYILPMEKWSKKYLLWASSDEGGDKDFYGMFSKIKGYFDKSVVTVPPGPRRPVSLEQWRPFVQGDPKISTVEDWDTALHSLLDQLPQKGLLVVSGSLYLVGAVRQRLQPIDL